MAKLQSVPDPSPDSKPQRATTTSFRIPTYWYNRVKEEARRLDISITQVYLRALTRYFDAFNTESSWETIDDPDAYSPSRFYTHSEDKKGHSFYVRAPIPKPLAGEINAIIQSGTVPQWRSMGDVVRDAVNHRVKYISKAIDNAELETAVDMAMLLADELRLMDEAEQAQELIEAVRLNAQAMIARDATPARVKKYLAQRREVADMIPEPYRPDYLDAISELESRLAKVEKKQNRRR